MRNKQDFNRDQLSRWFPPDNPFGSFGDNEVFPLTGGIFSSSLIRDISNHLIPFGGFSSRKNFSIELQPASKLFEELLAEALEDRHYYSRSDLREQVSGFVRLCATELLGIGTATYEIVFFRDHTTSEKRGSCSSISILEPCLRGTMLHTSMDRPRPFVIGIEKAQLFCRPIGFWCSASLLT